MSGSASLSRVGVWLGVSLALWIGGRAMDRETRVEIQSDAGMLRATIAGSTVETPITIESVDQVLVHAVASVFAPGGRSIGITQGPETVFVDELPRRFSTPRGRVVPVGDWWVDDFAGRGFVYSRDVDITGPFTLSAVFTGRNHQHLTVVFRGNTTAAVSFRRGLINNDIHIWNADGSIAAVTSIDPSPISDLLSALSIVVRSAAAAALLIAVFHLLAWLPQPAGPFAIDPPDAMRIASWAAAGGLAIAAVGASAWFATVVLERLPHLPDSVVYILQAKWLLAGRLVQEISPIQQHLTVPFTYVTEHAWVAHYPFGWPAILSPGLAAGAPWLVAPLLGGVYTLLLFLTGMELYSRSIGLTASALALLSPLACILFGSFLSHAASSTLLLLGLWLLARAGRRGGAWLGFAAGASFGLGFGIRPLSAAAIGLPAGLWLVSRLVVAGRRDAAARVSLAAIAGGCLAIVPTLAVNAVVTGNPLSFPYSLASGSMYSLDHIPFGLRNMDALLASTVPALFGWGWTMAGDWWWTALPLAFAAIPFLLRRAGHADWLLAACFAVLVVAHVGTKGHGLHGFGPRYYFDGFFALYLLTARGFQELARVGADHRPHRPGFLLEVLPGTAAALIFFVLWVSAATLLPHRLSLYRGYNNVDGKLPEQLAKLGTDRALILFADDDWRNWAGAVPFMSADPLADMVFATSRKDNRVLFAVAGDRPAFVWSDETLVPYDPH